ncbi:MAG: pyridoxamine 5'-phosphate oxidase family protein [Nitrospirales bacterium]|nr:pyridoxamine 5'-phosphate oxidase family protein [Nitrospirales bacterium]
MATIDEKCREVLEKTEWVAIATAGPDGPHLAATWGGYIRAVGIEDGTTIAIPAGGYATTGENLKKDSRVELLIASRQVQGNLGLGKGYRLIGTGEVQTAGPLVEKVKEKFPWARGALVIRVHEVSGQL